MEVLDDCVQFDVADGAFQESESEEGVKQGDVLARRMRNTGMLSFFGSTFLVHQNVLACLHPKMFPSWQSSIRTMLMLTFCVLLDQKFFASFNPATVLHTFPNTSQMSRCPSCWMKSLSNATVQTWSLISRARIGVKLPGFSVSTDRFALSQKKKFSDQYS